MSNEESGDTLEATLREFTSGQKLFRRYTLKRTLGRGGMGVVWLARDDELERDVALKFLPDLIVHDRAVLSDLKRETRRSLELTHKNIVRIYDFIHDQISGCISMEYVDGDTLSNLRTDRPLKIFEPHEIAEWISQLCDALDYAHNHAKIVHRDLKPSNLMVNQRGELKVADFGIARSLSDSMSMLTMDRGKSGTLLYMSPQQLDGERGSHLDDVYSLGASVFELLTSKPPFYSGNVDRQIREKLPPRMNDRRKELELVGEPIDETWEEVVRKCLAKDPARRPQSVSEVAKMLSVPSPKTRRSVRAAAEQTKKRLTMLVPGAVALALVIGAWFLVRMLMTPSKHESTAQLVVPSATVIPAPSSVTGTAAGGVIVNTSPSGATITLGGLDMEKSPATFKGVRPGTYPMRITLEGYETYERQIEVKENAFVDLKTIPLQRGKAVAELSSSPAGAKVLQNGAVIGTTPLRRDDLGTGPTTFLVIQDGYLPREVKANLDMKQPFNQQVVLVQAAPIYNGRIRVRGNSNLPTRAIAINLGTDLRSGTMTQESRYGDFVVKFTGVWEGTELHAVTRDVVSQPGKVRWTPESFTLHFGDDGKTASYECFADGETYIADLAPQAVGTGTVPRLETWYKGSIHLQGETSGAGRALTINLATDRRSGIMTQGTTYGDLVVKFNGVWDGPAFRAVTADVVSKPKKARWEPESFTLRFDEAGKTGSYECNSGGRIYTAQLAAQ